jgi:hypothetical protein
VGSLGKGKEGRYGLVKLKEIIFEKFSIFNYWLQKLFISFLPPHIGKGTGHFIHFFHS